MLLTPIANLFHSCGCDKEPTPASYSHKTLRLKNLDNSGKYPIESDVLQCNKNAYGIRLNLTREENIVACINTINSIFVQSTYAMKKAVCYDYVYSASDELESIKIFTLNDFDNQHLKNSDVTNYFKVSPAFAYIQNYIHTIDYTFESDFFDERMELLTFDLLLMNTPTTTNNQQFKVQILLSDGRILEQETAEIQLI